MLNTGCWVGAQKVIVTIKYNRELQVYFGRMSEMSEMKSLYMIILWGTAYIEQVIMFNVSSLVHTLPLDQAMYSV